jgi:lipopolysaccharide export system permease protein
VRILTRYVLREHIGPLLFALCALTSLLLLNYIAKQLSALVGKGLSWTIIFEFLALSIPFTVAMTLPMAVLVAILYAFSRLASENEISAMKANGVAMGSLLIPVAVSATILALGMVAFNDQILPRANHRLATLQRDIARKKPTFALREQVLNDIPEGSGFSLRADVINRTTNMMHGVHIYDLSQNEGIRTIHAESAYMALTSDERDLVLRLYDGEVTDISRETPSQINRVYFAVNQILKRDVANQLQRAQEDGAKSDRERSICDMQASYEDARVQYEALKFEMRERLVRQARDAVNGTATYFVAPDAPPPPEEVTWGGVYCEGLQFAAGRLPWLRQGAQAADSADRDSVPVAASQAAAPAPPPGQLPSAQPQLSQSYAFMDASAFAHSLGQELDNLAFRIGSSHRHMNSLAVEIHKKFSLAGACIVFVLVGVPFALRFPRGGVGLVIGASLAIFAISYVGLIAGESLADRASVSPFLAMWGANFALALIGIALMLRMGRESATKGSALAAMLEGIRDRIYLKRTRKELTK